MFRNNLSYFPYTVDYLFSHRKDFLPRLPDNNTEPLCCCGVGICLKPNEIKKLIRYL